MTEATNKEIFNECKETYAIKLTVQDVDILRILRENVSDCDAQYVVIAVEGGFSIFFKKKLQKKLEKYNLIEIHDIKGEEVYTMIDADTKKTSTPLLGKNIRSTGFTGIAVGNITQLKNVIEKIEKTEVLQAQEDASKKYRRLVKIISG